ncbi:hypothetical protein BBJ28_00005337 [Nothophytophthora sp. Chile5]|nr:hypothetical protein BBJ28_00005337 [Nothophytophthora sp. Chile5]
MLQRSRQKPNVRKPIPSPSSDMERSSRRGAAIEKLREAEEEQAHSSSDAGSSSSRLRRRREMRSNVESNSDGADTDASSVAALDKKPKQAEGAPQLRQNRRSSARKAAEENRKAREQEGGGGGDGEDEEQSGGDEEEGDKHHHPHHGNRERSLSNVSNTSSTSASSLASEHLTEEQRQARLDQQLAELEQKKRMVEDGTLAEYCRRVTAFKEERNRLLQTAELHKNLQLKNGQDLYGFEVQRAHHLWQHGKDVLKAELLGKMDAVMASLQAELHALSKHGAKAPEEATTAKQDEEKTAPSTVVVVVRGPNDPEAEEEGEVAELPAMESTSPEPKRRKTDPELPGLFPEQVVRLPLDAITADLAAIVGERKQTAQTTVTHLPNAGNGKTHALLLPLFAVLMANESRLTACCAASFKLERRRLFCGKHVFEDGDEVAIASPLVHEDYTGTISSITDDAVYVKLASGQKVSIFLPHLERRRCELKPLLRGTTASGSLQSMGWAECEPF